ncbi:MAG: biopolymer transporter ExbD [Leptospiraceae bacterium]|nr:biopolymer transporter ExbD [Leptospiraceae bacterium]MCB1304431.1 biopolymer transporter ExbD [Leptospiraceae bacterium]
MRIRRKSREADEIPLSSTADIAFLLIVFFLAASALLELRGVNIPLPKKNAPPMEIEEKNLFKVQIDDAGSYIYDGSKIDLASLREKTADSFKKNKELVVVIRPAPETPTGSVPRLIRMLQELRIQRVSLAMQKGKQ